MSKISRRKFSELMLGIGFYGLINSAHARQYQNKPLRIISLGGAITEIIYKLNLQKYLVGVDATSNYPTDSQNYPSVGYARTLSIEGVLSLNPTHILATEDVGPPAFIRTIKNNKKINFEILDSEYSFDGLINRVHRIGAIAGVANSAQTLIAQLNESWRFANADEPISHAQPKVLFLLSHQASRILVSGRDTGAAAMIRYAGGMNAINSYAGYKPLNIEAFIQANPDVILMTKQTERSLSTSQVLLKNPALGSVAALKNNRLISIDANQLLGFGPRLPQTILELRREIFS
jgi:iron complex transport system substrate-binding protein